MCMLLFDIAGTRAPSGRPVLALASTRDEFYFRPSRASHFWERDPQIVGGMDWEAGKEGGTWLAMARDGRLAALLNVVRPLAELTGGKRDRGFLAVDYLQGTVPAASYLEALRPQAGDFHPFLLLTLEISPWDSRIDARFLSNSPGDPTIRALSPGTHAFGNCAPDRPWRKVEYARKEFSRAVRESRSRDELLERSFSLLRDDTPHWPDPQLAMDAGPERSEDFLERLSAVFVRDPERLYGSRTHTVIVVDAGGRVDLVEKTMREPIDPSCSDQHWLTSHLQFPILPPPGLVSHL